MGQVKEQQCSSSMSSPAELKEKGNEAYKSGNYSDALAFYTQAIDLCGEDDREKSTYLKNRAAVHLKQEKYEEVVKDCSVALVLASNDPKALYRRCLAYQALGKIELAYADARQVHHLEPKNKVVEPVLAKLYSSVQERGSENARTSNKVQGMMDIVFNKEETTEKRESGGENLVVLARDNVGADLLWEKGVLDRIAQMVKEEKDGSLVVSGVRVVGAIAKGRGKEVWGKMGLEFFMNVMNSKVDDVITAGSYALQSVMDSLSGEELVSKWRAKKEKMNADERMERKNDWEKRAQIMEKNEKELMDLMKDVSGRVTSRSITGEARDALLSLIMKNCGFDELRWAELLLEGDGYQRLMEVAGDVKEYSGESGMVCTENTRMLVGACLGRMYDQVTSDKLREKIRGEVDKFVSKELLQPGMESKVKVMVAVTTLLTNAPEVGDSQIAKEGVLQMMLAMARSGEYLQQLVASEALIAAAAKKKDAATIIGQGMDILKSLYASKNDHIKVRALVGLCKLGASGGHDASIRPFADGSTTKLAEACRRFLVDPGKDLDLRRWAAEGLSYLTLDAEVKEKLIEDEKALKALIDLGATGRQNVTYGVVTTLVNLTNSYDKKEMNPEMLELAKFAKQHIPQDHDLDDQDFVDKRTHKLAHLGVTSALSALAKIDSNNMRELIGRVLNAICCQSELRGLVVQQGGSKALVPLALEGTDKGKRSAAQSLARIGITQDPNIAFPGARACDVVRPIAKLLNPNCDALENFEALMALGNLATVGESVRARMLKGGEIVGAVESYMFEDHELLRRAAVQCWTNLCQSPKQVERCEGKNDKVKYIVLLCGDDDVDVVKAAGGALAMLTEVSEKCCQKVVEDVEQWEECLLGILAAEDVDIGLRGAVVVQNMVVVGGEDVATKLLGGQIMEVLQALVVKARLDEGNAQPNVKLAKMRQVCEATLKEACKMKIIQPTEEAK